MPELKIVDGDGRLLPTTPIYLVSLSIYPRDTRSRLQLHADLLMRQQEAAGDLSELGFLLPILHRSPGANEVLRRAVKAQQGAQFASSVLDIMLCADRFHPDLDISASMAAWGIGEVSRRIKSVAATSERTQWRQWGTHKAVAHIRLAIETIARRHPGVPTDQMLYARVHDILNLAESIRVHAEERRLFRRRSLWRVPPSLPTEKVPVPLEPLSELLLDALLSYRPVNSGQY